jgi:phospho-N-acetylmuramoyl-pentapeptide-transferase
MTPQGLNLNAILLYCLVTFFVAFIAYPRYIKLLIRRKAGKQLRENDVSGQKAVIFNQLHAHKAGTPTMGGTLFLVIMLVMVLASLVVQYLELSRFSLFSSKETYVLLGGFFGMGLIGIVDDILNIQ